MEHEGTGQSKIGGEAWDAVPRDGPAVFIANTERLWGGRGLHGAWVRLDQTRPTVAAHLVEIMGGSDETGWAVIDQVGLGPVMVDETPISDLLGLAQESGGA